jgi:hypothetical protein
MIKIRWDKDPHGEFNTLKMYIGWGRTRLRLLASAGRRSKASVIAVCRGGVVLPEGRAEFCFVTMDIHQWRNK